MTVGPAPSTEALHLIDGLEITDPRVRAALLKVPREEFVPSSERSSAYEDAPVSLGVVGATASAPHMAVLQLEAAELRSGDHVLEVGAGMGYLAALIAELVAPSGTVDALEIDPHLAREARRRLAIWKPPALVRVHAMDGSEGLAEHGPYDRILVSCQSSEVRRAWTDQLAPDGRLVVPLGDEIEQTLTVVARSPAGWARYRGPECRFVPLRRRLPRDI